MAAVWPEEADPGFHLLEVALVDQPEGCWVVLRGCDHPLPRELAHRVALGVVKELRHNGHPVMPVVRDRG